MQGYLAENCTIVSQLTIMPHLQWGYQLLWICSVGSNPIFDLNAPIMRMVYLVIDLLPKLVFNWRFVSQFLCIGLEEFHNFSVANCIVSRIDGIFFWGGGGRVGVKLRGKNTDISHHIDQSCFIQCVWAVKAML